MSFPATVYEGHFCHNGTAYSVDWEAWGELASSGTNVPCVFSAPSIPVKGVLLKSGTGTVFPFSAFEDPTLVCTPVGFAPFCVLQGIRDHYYIIVTVPPLGFKAFRRIDGSGVDRLSIGCSFDGVTCQTPSLGTHVEYWEAPAFRGSITCIKSRTTAATNCKDNFNISTDASGNFDEFAQGPVHVAHDCWNVVALSGTVCSLTGTCFTYLDGASDIGLKTTASCASEFSQFVHLQGVRGTIPVCVYDACNGTSIVGASVTAVGFAGTTGANGCVNTTTQDVLGISAPGYCSDSINVCTLGLYCAGTATINLQRASICGTVTDCSLGVALGTSTVNLLVGSVVVGTTIITLDDGKYCFGGAKCDVILNDPLSHYSVCASRAGYGTTCGEIFSVPCRSTVNICLGTAEAMASAVDHFVDYQQYLRAFVTQSGTTKMRTFRRDQPLSNSEVGVAADVTTCTHPMAWMFRDGTFWLICISGTDVVYSYSTNTGITWSSKTMLLSGYVFVESVAVVDSGWILLMVWNNNQWWSVRAVRDPATNMLTLIGSPASVISSAKSQRGALQREEDGTWIFTYVDSSGDIRAARNTNLDGSGSWS